MIRKGIFYEMGISASEDNADELEERISGIVGMKNSPNKHSAPQSTLNCPDVFTPFKL